MQVILDFDTLDLPVDTLGIQTHWAYRIHLQSFIDRQKYHSNALLFDIMCNCCSLFCAAEHIG